MKDGLCRDGEEVGIADLLNFCFINNITQQSQANKET